MTSQTPRSVHSSRDVSPDSHPEAYDPFREPIELAHISRPSLDIRDAYGMRGQSPDEPPRELRSDTYFETTPTKGQYAQVQGGTISPRRSVRSGRESTYTVNSLYRGKSSDPDTQALVASRAGELAQWHIYWTTPALVIFLFLAGFAAAVGHHMFYNHLNGQPAIDQLRMVRYGTALAFFVKSTFVGTAVMCNRQRIWYTFRRKAMTIKGIDGLFSATEDPTQFFLNWEMVRNGKLATFMAVCAW
ncbi:formylmethionine deformylase [Pyrenophora seminiperda CCB06]|uniref:Formylmethionine deformylase n=1 Tax=Pyrenophora seminiperda CCB06 TaxID=1302712 RepID=A0A3M7MDU5_9PLEO|nr:formylmethionine deformylase [Pyrenophora seminiperda CCB06]